MKWQQFQQCLPATIVLLLAYLSYVSATEEFTTTTTTTFTTTTTTTISIDSIFSRSPRGLLLGLLSVTTVQVLFTIPYYYLLRNNIINRPFIQIKRSTKQKPFWSGLVSHLSRIEGFVLLGGYLSFTWLFDFVLLVFSELDGSRLFFIMVIRRSLLSFTLPAFVQKCMSTGF